MVQTRYLGGSWTGGKGGFVKLHQEGKRKKDTQTAEAVERPPTNQGNQRGGEEARARRRSESGKEAGIIRWETKQPRANRNGAASERQPGAIGQKNGGGISR